MSGAPLFRQSPSIARARMPAVAVGAAMSVGIAVRVADGGAVAVDRAGVTVSVWVSVAVLDAVDVGGRVGRRVGVSADGAAVSSGSASALISVVGAGPSGG